MEENKNEEVQEEIQEEKDEITVLKDTVLLQKEQFSPIST